jgi:hypothetical protein
MQANRKTREGPAHPDRDAQFRYISQQVRRFRAQAECRWFERTPVRDQAHVLTFSDPLSA